MVKELQTLLPKEDLLYFGDDGNNPFSRYGKEGMLLLAEKIIDFMRGEQVKVIALACNTLSIYIDHFREYCPDIPIIDILTPTADRILALGEDEIGLLATKYSVENRALEKLLQKKHKEIRVYGATMNNAAAIMDSGFSDPEEIGRAVEDSMMALQEQGAFHSVVLGCTRYPAFQPYFEERFPQYRYLDPAKAQAEAVRELLNARGLLNDKGNGNVQLLTSGSIKSYQNLVKILSIDRVTDVVHKKMPFPEALASTRP